MFALYHGPELAAHHQAELLDEVAADELARSAPAGRKPSTDSRPSAPRRLVMLVADALSAFRVAVGVAGRRARSS